ncbi:hypothetical protein ACW2QC_12765 [Virgibacillus sp. FSP13]
MQCSNCGQQTEEGKFCTNCGAQLPNDEYAAAADPTINTNDVHPPSQEPHQEQASYQSNEAVDKLKTAGANFGHFFVTLVKGPSEAKKANSNDWISSVTTIVIFSLLIALGYHLSISTIPTGFFGGPSMSFFDSFVVPLIEFIILFVLVAALTFAGVKFAAQALTFMDVLAKYGGYLIPFLLLFTVGFLFALVDLTSLSALFILISVLGALLIAPTLILLEQPAVGFDRIYVLLGIYFISLLVFGFFIQSFIESIVGTLLGGMFGGY